MKKKHKRIKNADAKYLGTEPTVINSDLDYIQALNWYNYHYDVPRAKKWLVEYCNNNQLSSRNIREINITMCAVARMLNRGMDIEEKHVNYLHEKINDKVTSADVSVIKISHHKTFPLDNFEEILDDFYNSNYQYFDPKVYQMLVEMKARPIDGKAVSDYYSVLLEDLDKEGYEFLGKRKLSAYKKFVSKMVDDAMLYSSNQRKPRKPRKKKPITAEKMISKLKYKEIDNDLQLKSIAPEKIIGATTVYIYDTKYKKLSKLLASCTPFTIKGTTIQNVDEENSESKILRKPKEFLSEFVSNGKLFKKRAFDELKTKPSPATGRVTEYKLILQAY